MKTLIAAFGLVAASAGTAFAQMPPAGASAPAPAPSTRAPDYVRMAASGDMFEIQSSQLALQASSDPAIKSVAQMIINDHTRMSSELKAAAASARVPMPPPALAPHHAQALQRLEAARGAGFDAAYRREQVMAHQEALNLHRTYAGAGTVLALKAVAAKAVPVIEMHLQHVQSPPPQAGGGTAPPMSDMEARSMSAGERG